jgi:hypothetical protein
LSLGEQDQLGRAMDAVAFAENLSDDARAEHVIRVASELYGSRDPLARPVTELSRYVPYRLLTPWFAPLLKGRADREKNAIIADAATQTFSGTMPPLYLFRGARHEVIQLHPKWLAYFRQHIGLIEQFCLWNLVSYLERTNPNVPGISLKLTPMAAPALAGARKFWAKLIAAEPVRCIYSGNELSANDFDIDHFLPWRFVSHDQIWNLAPTHPSANRSKGAQLPSLEKYLSHFGAMQYRCLRATLQEDRKKNIEEYSLLLRAEKYALARMPEETFCQKLRGHLEPLFQIASNMGFSSGWKYGG